MLTYDNLSSLFDRYDGFLIDQFGVLMSGNGPYPGAQDALADLAKRGKPVVILSNSGKRSEVNNARLVQNGFDRNHFATVLTSGEVAYDHIRQMLGPELAAKKQALVILKDGDSSPFDDLPLSRTTNPEAADILIFVNRDPSQPLSNYKPNLQRLAQRNVPAICTNPDLMMLTADGVTESAGHLAQIYEAYGGTVHWFGKPHSGIYDRARKLLNGADPKKTLCVGDSIHHDIGGGASAGFKTALVRTGIHADLNDSQVESAIASSRFVPDHILLSFS